MFYFKRNERLIVLSDNNGHVQINVSMSAARICKESKKMVVSI